MNKELLKILVCPLCKGELTLDKDAQELICQKDRLAYKINDGIPVLLQDEARKLDEPA